MSTGFSPLTAPRGLERALSYRLPATLICLLIASSLIMLRSGSAQSGAYVITFAGSPAAGFADGAGQQALFSAPLGIAIDAGDNLIVADFHNHRIRRIDPQGNVTTIAGAVRGYQDGAGIGARFYGPAGVALDPAGNIIVADYGNNRIRQIGPNGRVTTIAGSGAYGYANGSGLSAKFARPSGVVVDGAGNIYVADADNHLIRKIDANRNVTTLAGSTPGYADGPGSNAQFNFYGGAPQLCFDANGNLIVADFFNNRIRQVAPDGTTTTLAGNGNMDSIDGPAGQASFFLASGVGRDLQGNIVVADWHNARVRMINLAAKTVSTLAGNGAETHADGPALSASFIRPGGVAVDSRGNIFVSDYYDNCIRRIGRPVTPPPTVTPSPKPTPTPTATPTPTVTPSPPPGPPSLINPSFETGDWSGWTLNSIPIEGGPSIVSDASLVSDGQYALKFSAHGRVLYDSCKQAVKLAAGNYTVSCDVRSSIGTVATLGIIFSDGTQGPINLLGPGASGRLSLNFTVSDPSQPITVYFQGKQTRYVRSWVIVDNFILSKN